MRPPSWAGSSVRPADDHTAASLAHFDTLHGTASRRRNHPSDQSRTVSGATLENHPFPRFSSPADATMMVDRERTRGATADGTQHAKNVFGGRQAAAPGPRGPSARRRIVVRAVHSRCRKPPDRGGLQRRAARHAAVRGAHGCTAGLRRPCRRRATHCAIRSHSALSHLGAALLPRQRPRHALLRRIRPAVWRRRTLRPELSPDPAARRMRCSTRTRGHSRSVVPERLR
jgi:hypothetical protein